MFSLLPSYSLHCFCLYTHLSQLSVKQGRLEPVETRVKNNKRGLGSKEQKPKPKVEDDVETAPKRPKVSKGWDPLSETLNVLL